MIGLEIAKINKTNWKKACQIQISPEQDTICEFCYLLLGKGIY